MIKVEISMFKQDAVQQSSKRSFIEAAQLSSVVCFGSVGVFPRIGDDKNSNMHFDRMIF